MYWEPDMECLDREELEQLQLERLQATLNRVYAHVPFYRRRFDALGLAPEDVGSLADLGRLPPTTREELRAQYPYGFFAMPLREVVRIHAPTGEAGEYTAMGYTRNDIKTWTGLAARSLVAGGVTKDDVVQVCLDYGLFSGAFGLHYGAERLGASVIPVSSAHMARQVRILRDFKVTALVATPTFALRLAEALRELAVPVSALSLKWALLTEEPWSEETRRTIEEALGVTATDHYGVMEVLGPGLAGECLEKRGMHVQEDHFLLEVLDPETLAPVAPGQVGELVVTTLTKEAFPLVRYRTRDLAAWLPGQCPCGRTGRRLSRLAGRSDDLVIVGGVNVFPAQIEAVIRGVEGAPGRFRLELDRSAGADQATVLVEAGEALFVGDVRRQKDVVDRLRRGLAQELGLDVQVKLVEKKTLAGDARRVVDRRRV